MCMHTVTFTVCFVGAETELEKKCSKGAFSAMFGHFICRNLHKRATAHLNVQMFLPKLGTFFFRDSKNAYRYDYATIRKHA